jgi:hypothetical protein
MTVTGHAFTIGNDRGSASEDAIEKRGLAHVRASYDTNDR